MNITEFVFEIKISKNIYLPELTVPLVIAVLQGRSSSSSLGSLSTS
jgi:hypothetical protein